MDKTDSQAIEAYNRDGYLRLDNVFSEDEMKRVSSAFSPLPEEQIEDVGIIYEDGSQVVRSIMGWQRSKGILNNFARDQRILSWVQKILGQDVEFHQTKYNPKAPDIAGGEKWDPHRGDTFWCFKDGVPNPEKMMSVFIAITDQTEENGAVYAWKGSHIVTLEQIKPNMLGLDEQKGIEQDTAAYLSLQIKPEMLEDFDRQFERLMFDGKAGTVWLLNAGLLHASSANKSKENRELVANVFRTLDNRPTHPRPQHYLAEPSHGPLMWSSKF